MQGIMHETGDRVNILSPHSSHQRHRFDKSVKFGEVIEVTYDDHPQCYLVRGDNGEKWWCQRSEVSAPVTQDPEEVLP